MLRSERSIVRGLKRVRIYGTMLRRGRARSAVANCLLRAMFSCSRVCIKFSCSALLD